MVGSHRALLLVAAGIAIFSRPAAAQREGSSSLTHTVSVTVPPRVKIQVASLAPALTATVRAGDVQGSTQGLALSVSATRGWILSAERRAASNGRTSPTRWSLDAASGFSSLTSAPVRIASGAISNRPKAAQVFFRSAGGGSASAGDAAGESPIILTVSAP